MSIDCSDPQYFISNLEEAFMQVKKLSIMMVTAGILLIIGMGIWLASAQPVHAQCGSQASSCKNCHETQGQMPVNNDGTAWHTQHAFGDFCYPVSYTHLTLPTNREV